LRFLAAIFVIALRGGLSSLIGEKISRKSNHFRRVNTP
jgi:dolichol kinase